MQTAMIKDLPKGEFFKRTVDAKKVYQKAEYRRDLAKYQCDDCDDIWGNGLLMKGKTLVFIGFEY